LSPQKDTYFDLIGNRRFLDIVGCGRLRSGCGLIVTFVLGWEVVLRVDLGALALVTRHVREWPSPQFLFSFYSLGRINHWKSHVESSISKNILGYWSFGSISLCQRGLVVRRWSNKPDVVGSIPVTKEFFLISCDSNQVPKWFGTHYNLEVPL